jgi:HEPN domain-containing protein
MQPTPIEIICYHCEQSAEKYLKGYIILNGGNLYKTHDLTRLNELAKEYDNTFSEIDDDCVELVDYGVAVGYPFHIGLMEQDIKMAIESAETIARFITEKANR